MFETRPARRPRRVVLRTIGFGMSALLTAALLTWNPAQTTGWSQAAAEGTLWQLLNGARTNNGLAPLQYHGTLQGIARWRSQDMLNRNYFSHTIPGCNCLVYAYYDQNGLAYDWAGENIGWNSGVDDASSPVRLHEQFMGSASHRNNILTPGFTHGAVGAAAADNKMFQGYVQNTRMYTQLFLQAPAAAAPRPPAPAPAPPPPPTSGGVAPAPVAQPAPAASAAPVAAAAPVKPKPAKMTVDTPTRPRSSAGLDGVATLVLRRGGSDAEARLAADDALGVERSGRVGAKLLGAKNRGMEVTAPDAEPGFFESLLGLVSG